MPIKREPVNFVDQKAASMPPKFLVHELLDLNDRIEGSRGIKDALSRAHIPFIPVISIPGWFDPEIYLSNFIGLRYWTGAFSKGDPGKIDDTPEEISFDEICEIQTWIKRSVQALKDFATTFPGENIRRMSWAEKVALGREIGSADLRVVVPQKPNFSLPIQKRELRIPFGNPLNLSEIAFEKENQGKVDSTGSALNIVNSLRKTVGDNVKSWYGSSDEERRSQDTQQKSVASNLIDETSTVAKSVVLQKRADELASAVKNLIRDTKQRTHNDTSNDGWEIVESENEETDAEWMLVEAELLSQRVNEPSLT